MPDTFKSHGLDIPVEVFPGAAPAPTQRSLSSTARGE